MNPFVGVISPLVVMLAAVMKRAERRVLRQLRDSEAHSPESAQPLEPMAGLGQLRLSRLIDGGAVIATPDGRYYLDEDGWEHYRSERRRRAFAAVAAVLMAGVVVYLFTK